MGARTWLRGRMARAGGGLVLRANAVSALVSLLIGGAFASLVLTIGDLSDAVDRTSRSREVLVAADQLKTLVLDAQSGEQGYVITGRPEFLDPWNRARANFGDRAAQFERLAAAGDAGQGVRARAITLAAGSYLSDYSAPVVLAAQRELASARTPAVTEEGRSRMSALRAQFTRFTAIEHDLLDQRQAHAAADARRVTTAAAVGIGGSMTLVLGSGAYLTRSVVRPLRRASAMAGRVADGDFAARMTATGPAEIGRLQGSLNTMAGSLETSREELRRAAREQASLRRTATLVARGAPPPEVFGAVAAEVGGVFGAACAAVCRQEADGGATVVGAWCATGDGEPMPEVGTRQRPDPRSAAGLAMRTGRPARATFPAGPGMGPLRGGSGAGVSVASPVHVAGRLWGVVIAAGPAADPPAAGAEERMAEFTELIATAIANAESRAELAASRARVVAAADESRRRVERDLHDGTQQRLIALALELRTAQTRLPAGLDDLQAQLSRVGGGLAEALTELQDLSRGLHPAILSQGGLGPALRALSRRSAVPVELSFEVDPRLPEHVEAASYYVISEALANVGKHARASFASVGVARDGPRVLLSVRDDGVGGADPGRGSGLVGLRDRVEAAGGDLEITSPPGGGTWLRASIPTALPSPYWPGSVAK